MDTAHFVLGAFLCLIWRSARQPFIRTVPGRLRYSVPSAVDSCCKEIITHRTTGNINPQSACELLGTIRLQHPRIAITLIMDNARYQHCEILCAQAQRLDIELLFLPAYCLPLDKSQSGRLSPPRSGCPNLNFIE